MGARGFGTPGVANIGTRHPDQPFGANANGPMPFSRTGLSSGSHDTASPDDCEAGYAGESWVIGNEGEPSYKGVSGNHAIVELRHVQVEKNPPSRGAQ